MTERKDRKQMTDPLLRKLFNQHKVIAYPNEEQRRLQQNSSLSTKSSDAVLDSSFLQVPVLKPVSSRPRSLSTGRQRRSRDNLVQSVYDRLGVSRGALMDANNTVPAMASTPRPTNERGRSRATEANEPEAPRPRSLSRDGRLRSLWPPASTSEAPVSKSNRVDGTCQELTSLKQQQSSRHSRTVDDMAPSSPRRNVRSPEETVEMLSPKPPYRHEKTEVKARSFRNNASHIVGHVNEWKDEKKDGESTPSEVEEVLISGPPVKDRMRAFLVPEVSKALPKKVTDKQYPPLIDIYADERNRHESNDDEMSNSHRKTSEAGMGNVDISSDVQSSRSAPKKLASKSTGNQLASSFLAAIHTSTDKPITPRSYGGRTIPVMEVSGDDQGSVTETVSVSVLSSSASDDQLSPTHPVRYSMPAQSVTAVSSTMPVKKSHWLELRNKKLAATTTASSTASPTIPVLPSLRAVQSTSTTTSDQQSNAAMNANIERMVDERVKARLFELERRVEEQMRTFLQRMDERVAARIADLDRN